MIKPLMCQRSLQLLLSSLLWFLPLRLLSLLSMVQVGLRSLKLLAFFKRLHLHVCLAVLTHLLVLDMLRLLLMHAFTWMPLGCWCCLRVLVLHRFPPPAHPRIPASRQRVLEKCAQRWRPGCQDVTPTPTPTIQISARRDLRTRGSRRVSHCLLKHFQLRKQVHINIDHFFVSRLITWLNRHVRACSSWSSRLPHWVSREQVGWQSQPRAGYTLDCWTASGFLQIRAKQASHK